MVRIKRSIGTTEEKVIQAVSASDNGGGHSLIRLSSGVVLKAKKVNPFLVQEVVRQFDKPKPPIVMVEDIGKEVENENDPGYVDAMNDYNGQVSMAIVDLFIVKGTELYGKIPQDISGVDDTNWQDDLDAIGVKIGTNPRKKYIMWVKFVAAPNDQDIMDILSGVGRESGVAEADVQSAAQSFRNNAGR